VFATAVVTIAVPPATTAVNAQTRPATIRHTQGATTRQVDVTDTLRALDRLHAFGYTINTPARAERAIRHWQRANGLTVDGIVGPEVLASLGLGRLPPTASVPAVRLDPPPAPAADAGMPETIEQIIRDVWPDDLEDHALAIANRESRLVPTARNACCYGLFQIHWRAHRDWLATIGVTSPIQLLDAATNARAAFALFQLDGWAPWAL
jgi:peptidoglycan hydrolase-like protein with peptidoglycan-binding domain